ncbi:hypothetical protein [Thermococcus sp.]
MGRKAVILFLSLFLLFLLILTRVNEKDINNPNWNDYVLSELRFRDNITAKALDYARSLHPDWQWSVATLCIWPNETATVLLYGNYTINCKGPTCSRTRGLLYAVNLNLTDLGLISLKKRLPMPMMS